MTSSPLLLESCLLSSASVGGWCDGKGGRWATNTGGAGGPSGPLVLSVETRLAPAAATVDDVGASRSGDGVRFGSWSNCAAREWMPACREGRVWLRDRVFACIVRVLTVLFYIGIVYCGGGSVMCLARQFHWICRGGGRLHARRPSDPCSPVMGVELGLRTVHVDGEVAVDLALQGVHPNQDHPDGSKTLWLKREK